jgi:hypothetical protein
VSVNAVLHGRACGGLADIHKPIKLAGIGGCRVRDSDFNGVESIDEAVFLEQDDWNIIDGGKGVDCLLVDTIYRRRFRKKRKKREGNLFPRTKIDDTWAVSGALIAPIFNSL